MASCKWCKKSGWLVGVDNNGLCKSCAPVVVPEISSICRVIVESGKIAGTTRKVETKLSRCSVAIRNCELLRKYEEAGIPTLDQQPSDVIDLFRREIIDTVDDAIREETFSARQKAEDASTDAGKLGGYGKAIDKLIKLQDEVVDVSQLELAVYCLRQERDALRASLLCNKAEVWVAKGKPAKAVDIYIEALMALKHDGTPDDEQFCQIETIRKKIEDLGGTAPI